MYNISIVATNAHLLQAVGFIRLSEINLNTEPYGLTAPEDKKRITGFLKTFQGLPITYTDHENLNAIKDEWLMFLDNYANRADIECDYTSVHFHVVIKNISASK